MYFLVLLFCEFNRLLMLIIIFKKEISILLYGKWYIKLCIVKMRWIGWIQEEMMFRVYKNSFQCLKKNMVLVGRLLFNILVFYSSSLLFLWLLFPSQIFSHNFCSLLLLVCLIHH